MHLSMHETVYTKQKFEENVPHCRSYYEWCWKDLKIYVFCIISIEVEFLLAVVKHQQKHKIHFYMDNERYKKEYCDDIVFIEVFLHETAASWEIHLQSRWNAWCYPVYLEGYLWECHALNSALNKDIWHVNESYFCSSSTVSSFLFCVVFFQWKIDVLQIWSTCVSIQHVEVLHFHVK